MGAVPPVVVAVHVIGVPDGCGEGLLALNVTVLTGPSVTTYLAQALASPLPFELPALRTATPT
jgi:hypothetical protein